MATKIRLQRHGRKSYAFYQIVVADSRAPRDGKFIERIGSYNPNTNPATVDLNFERALYWLQVGAQPTDTTRNILSREGVCLKKHLLEGVKKGAFDEATAETKFQAWLKNKQASVQAVKDKDSEAAKAAAIARLEAEKEANKAKEAEVKQFIFMSSMIVYSGCETTHITKDTKPKAENFYGDSKLQADLKLQEMNDDSFKVVVVRPPMIYGKGSKGNYPQLVKLATKLPVFPIVNNKRSMLHIDNLCEFIKLMIDNEESGVFFPQNSKYTNTSDMVQ